MIQVVFIFALSTYVGMWVEYPPLGDTLGLHLSVTVKNNHIKDYEDSITIQGVYLAY